MIKLGDIGEFKFIDDIKGRTKTGRGVTLGIGDDAAIVRCGRGMDILFTTDMLIEDRHFSLSQATAYEIGWKAMAVNISDIAAMAGVPKYAVVAVGLPGHISLRFARQLYRGLCAVAEKFGISLVGGDTNRSEKIVISVSLIGQTEKGSAARRSNAKPGDVIFVSGALGGSYASKKHLKFIPKIHEARFLAGHFNLGAMMDLSDGLSSDIHRLCRASRVGALLDARAIPVSKAARNPDAALSDGEDFELLFTLPAKEAARLAARRKKTEKFMFYPIGRIVEKKYGVHLITVSGAAELLPEKGFDHFKRRER